MTRVKHFEFKAKFKSSCNREETWSIHKKLQKNLNRPYAEFLWQKYVFSHWASYFFQENTTILKVLDKKVNGILMSVILY